MGYQRQQRRRPLNNIVWYFIIGAVLVAAWRILPSHEPKDWFAWAQQSSDTLDQGYDAAATQQRPEPALQAWEAILPDIKVAGSDTQPANPGTANTQPPTPELTSAAQQRLQTLTITSENTVGYDRDTWRHWDNITPCWTVREAVLARAAEPGTLTIQNKAKQPTSDLKTACYITGGTWNDPYTGQTFTNPEDLDIDHLVPLAEAHASGAQNWDETTKRDYANDLRSNHLIAVSASANRSKSDKDPAEWLPPNTAIHCGYAASWIAAKQRWNLSIDPKEHQTLTNILNTCPS